MSSTVVVMAFDDLDDDGGFGSAQRLRVVYDLIQNLVRETYWESCSFAHALECITLHPVDYKRKKIPPVTPIGGIA
jgi:hypothetical protein